MPEAKPQANSRQSLQRVSSSAQERIQHVHQSKENYNEEGQDILDNIIMVLAENKYKSIFWVGEWNAPSKEQKEILTLTAMLKTLSKKLKTNRNEESYKKYEWKKVPPLDLKYTKQKKGKKYN